MSLRPDHLIERAAARLNTLQAADAQKSAPPVVVGSSVDARTLPEAELARAVSLTQSDEAWIASALPSATAASQVGLASAGPDQPPELDLPRLERAGLVVGRSTRTRISEEYRIAVGRITRAAERANASGTRNPLILVTSAKPGEGKSFTALNLAAVMAQNGPRPVLLVDIDLKQGSLSDLLELGGRRGLYDVSTPEIPDPRSLLVSTEIPRLSIIPGGATLQGELGASFTRPLGPRIAALAEAFPDDTIVMDAPPCLATSDPSTLAALASQVVLVVEAGRTQREEVEAALEFVKSCPTVTMLLNKVRQTSRQTFGSYDYRSSYQ